MKAIRQMLYQFVTLACFTVYLYYVHQITSVINVDRIIPECFRGDKYGDCDYYTPFYKKNPDPFEKEPLHVDIKQITAVSRDDYKGSQWNVKWRGKNLRGESPFVNNDPPEMFSTDPDRIVRMNNNFKSDFRQKHETKPSVLEEDFTSGLENKDF